MDNIFSNVELVVFNIGNYEENNKRVSMKMHHHTSLEISYVVSGELILSYLDSTDNSIKTEHLFSNQFFIVKPNCLHKTDVPSALKSIGVEFVSNSTPDFMNFLNKSIYFSFFPTAVKMLKDKKEVFIFNGNKTLENSLLRLEKHFNNSGQRLSLYEQATYEVSLKNMFIELIKCCEKNPRTNEYNIYINRAMNYLTVNYNKTVTMENLAIYLGISSSYLQKLFKNELHSTVINELSKIRIEKAKTFLLEQNYTILQTAKSCGFNSSQAFIACFKKHTSQSPSEFKQSYYERNILKFKLDKNFKEETIS